MLQVGISMGESGALMPSWIELWNEWEIQIVVVLSFSLQVILFFFAGIRRYTVSSLLKVLLWLVYLLADVVATYALGHMSSSLLKKSSSEHQLVALWAPFLLLHLGGQDTITAYALEDNELWRRHLLNMFVQVAGTAYVLYKYINTGGATFVPAAMLVLAAGVVKYGERIWALKLASKGGSHYRKGLPREAFLWRIYDICHMFLRKKPKVENEFLQNVRKGNDTVWVFNWTSEEKGDCFTKNRQFGTYALIVMTAHGLCDVLVKPLILERNEASIQSTDQRIGLLSSPYRWDADKRKDESADRRRRIGEVYNTIEVELALMYDMLYTKAQVIHTRYGYCIRAISLVCCFAALLVFTKSKRDGYSTPNIVITFGLLSGACVLEVASVFKAIGSTWTHATLRGNGWNWLANAILFARYYLVVVKDGRWSDSVGQFNFTSFCAHSTKDDLKRAIAGYLGLQDLWSKAHCTKHAKLSPALKESVWDLLKGKNSHMVQIEGLAIRSGYWARRFRGFDQSEQLDWSMEFEFQKSVLIWHIATSTFIYKTAVQSELVDKDMGEAVNTLSHYMMYLLIEHPDMLPNKSAARDMFDETRTSFDWYPRLNNFWTSGSKLPNSENAVLKDADRLAHIMIDMKLGLTHKMVIIGTVWMEMLCYAATNASEGFHSRQLSNGGEFLTHILLLTKHGPVKPPIEVHPKVADETVEPNAGPVELTEDDCCNDEIIEIH
ncbi:hypothetical protein CFC21_105687 [Triticum aestivum]|uniref:DUF4220 domain-containing protein n=2 Tax=Triticum aestivum TaxID=4565 RepID=A0A3B6SPJ9_WHEAT|nr:hypothetical protein CFC21_105687 [Triticum aestivum]